MRRIVQFIALVILVSLPLHAKVLIIPKKGPSIWAKSITETATAITYVDDSGKKNTVPASEIAFTLPAIKRGTKYADADIDATITKIAAAKRRYPNLRKQLDPLANEWSALKRGDAGDIAGSVKQIQAAFDTKNASYVDLKDAKSKLAMLKYRDLQKQHGPAIDQATSALTEAYVASAISRLQKLATATPKLHAHIRSVSELTEDVKIAAPTDPRAKQATDIKQKEMAAAEKAIIADAAKAFNRGKTLDGYLVARTRLRAWQRLLPDNDPRIATVDKHLASLINALKRTQPTYDFRNRGFPFTRNDYAVLKTTINNSTSLKPADDTEDIVFLFPPQPLAPLKSAKNPPFQLRAVFNETPPTEGEWAFRIQPMGGNPPAYTPFRLPPLKNAATTISISADLSAYAGEIDAPSGNKPNAVGQIVHRNTDDDEWQPKSWYLGLQVR